jgi:hypothetical protein
LTGESIDRKQLLRCDNAENDPRVNLETCREMGIASIVVMPLVRPNGVVCGVFELFSDHAYAFEERDLTALERMAGLTLTALDMAENRPPQSRARTSEPVRTLEPQAGPAPEIKTESPAAPEARVDDAVSKAGEPEPAPARWDGPAEDAKVAESPKPAPVADTVPEAMRRVPKCSSCGFPVSEGRTICLDCEKKKDISRQSAEPLPADFVPAFLSTSPPLKESWLANHVNWLAILVVVLGILVAVVVFR